MPPTHSVAKLARRYRVTSGKRFRLEDSNPDDTLGPKIKEQSEQLLTEGVRLLAEMQERLYAQDFRVAKAALLSEGQPAPKRKKTQAR